MPASTFVDDLKHVARNTADNVRRQTQLTILKMQALPRATRTKVGICAAVVALFFGGLALRGKSPAPERRSPPAIRAEERATLADVRPPSPAAQRSYAVGKVEESQGSYKAAAESYAIAARQGNARALNKLVAMSHSPKCEVRSEAADALGTLHNKKARTALRKLASARYKDEPSNPGIFSCSSRRAAEKALDKQRG
jgi:adenylate cyclase